MSTTVDSELGERLAFMGIGDEDKAVLRGLSSVVSDAVGPALDLFYRKVRTTPQTRHFFADDQHADMASSRQRKHWDTILRAEYAASYSAAVKTIGSVHARIGLEPRWYIGGYALVAEQLVAAVIRDRFPKGRTGLFGRGADAGLPERVAKELGVLVKAVMLDVELAVSVYLDRLDEQRRQAEL